MLTHEKINEQMPVAIKHSEFILPYDFVWFHVLNLGVFVVFVLLGFFFLVSILCHLEYKNAAEL